MLMSGAVPNLLPLLSFPLRSQSSSRPFSLSPASSWSSCLSTPIRSTRASASPSCWQEYRPTTSSSFSTGSPSGSRSSQVWQNVFQPRQLRLLLIFSRISNIVFASVSLLQTPRTDPYRSSWRWSLPRTDLSRRRSCITRAFISSLLQNMLPSSCSHFHSSFMCYRKHSPEWPLLYPSLHKGGTRVLGCVEKKQTSPSPGPHCALLYDTLRFLLSGTDNIR